MKPAVAFKLPAGSRHRSQCSPVKWKTTTTGCSAMASYRRSAATHTALARSDRRQVASSTTRTTTRTRGISVSEAAPTTHPDTCCITQPSSAAHCANLSRTTMRCMPTARIARPTRRTERTVRLTSSSRTRRSTVVALRPLNSSRSTRCRHSSAQHQGARRPRWQQATCGRTGSRHSFSHSHRPAGSATPLVRHRATRASHPIGP